jgi:hypothetical protein
MKRKSLIVVFISLMLALHCKPAKAKVSVSTGGSSDGDPLVSATDPVGVNRTVLTLAKGGSIKTATARSVFTKERIMHGNKVISRGTDGDAEFTHTNANSVFAGRATFHSDDGQPVDNFTIDLGINGTLKCKTPDPDIPQFFSLAQMSADVIVDADSKFSGTATQDGAGPFSASGDISTGDFTSSANTASIHKSFPIDLGTLSDGQKLAFFFAGSTLVSYGSDVPITFCSADFFHTDTFQAAKKQAGKISVEAGQSVDVGFIPADAHINSESDVLFIESPDESLLSDIASIQVIIALGGGNFTATAGDLGDVDSNGISDVVLTADTADNQTTMINALNNSSNNTVFVFGQTNTGDAFAGTLDLSSI